MHTTIAQKLQTAGLKAAYDAACKKILLEKVILAWILQQCLWEYQSCTIEEIAERYIEGTAQIDQVMVGVDEGMPTAIQGISTEDTTIQEGTVSYDIRFLATLPDSKEQVHLIINVEVQNDFYPGYPLVKRGIYYGGRMLSAQYGTEFTGSHYEKLKKVYSIFITNL
ncbi:MAG: hypothetical protein IJV50_12075 [Lachnospiraceae bacterium]|nr:hypothetical protein [Lachnospiraceae bacterium]